MWSLRDSLTSSGEDFGPSLVLDKPNQNIGTALVNLIEWLTHDGQAYAATIGYVALPKNIQALAHSSLDQVVGPSGAPFLK